MEQGASFGEANALKDAFGFGWRKFGVEMGKGVGAGIAGALVNFAIGQGDKYLEKKKMDEIYDEWQNTKTEDSGNDIGIIANHPKGDKQ